MTRKPRGFVGLVARMTPALFAALALAVAAWYWWRATDTPCAEPDCTDPLELEGGSIRGNRDGTPGRRVE